MMDEQLDSLIRAIRKRVRADDPSAVERAAKLAEDYPDEPEVWRLLAFARSLNDDLDGAVAATTRMMALTPPHPAWFDSRGRYELKRGDLQAALADFDKGIALSIELQDPWCLKSLYFLRANVLYTFGRKAEALADLEHVEDDHVEWSTPFVNKFELVSECEGAPRPEASMDEPLNTVLDDINKRAQADPPRTLERVIQLAEKYPGEPNVWSTMVYAYAINGDQDGALVAATRLVEVAPRPASFYRRAYYHHRLGNLEAALADLTQAIALAQQEDEYDMEPLYFARADVLAALGSKALARADLEHVRDGYARMTTKLRTKEDILEDCKE